MALNNVTINQTQGTSGRTGAGFDFYSGIIFYGTAPSVAGKWASSADSPVIKYQQMTSYGDAASAGIIPFTDNTASTSTLLLTAAASGAGFIIKITSTEPTPNGGSNVVTLCSYTTQSGDTVEATLGANLTATINANTITTGYSASFNAGTETITITAPKSKGISLNTGTPYAFIAGGSSAAVTITQNVVAGTASEYALWDYHISEYFRMNADGNLFVGIISATSARNEMNTLQKVAQSKLRQIGIFDTVQLASDGSTSISKVLECQTAALLSQPTAPYSVLFQPNIFVVSDLSVLHDQNLNTANKVNLLLSQDGNAYGAQLFVVSGQTVGNIGAALGALSASRVSSSWAQPISMFNLSDGTENEVAAFGNGQLASAVSSGLQTQLDNYRYTFFRKFGDTVTGTYFTDNKCCIKFSSDYAFINDNRVSDKVSRICYSTLVPKLASELIFNTDGTLSTYAISSFETDVKSAIEAGMITGYGNMPLISGVGVSIDPSQPVRQTSNLTINVTIVENGIARNITVNIGFGTL